MVLRDTLFTLHMDDQRSIRSIDFAVHQGTIGESEYSNQALAFLIYLKGKENAPSMTKDSSPEVKIQGSLQRVYLFIQRIGPSGYMIT